MNGPANSDRPDGGPPPLALLLGPALVIGLYAMAPGFYLDGLHVRPGKEVVDHSIPGLVVLALIFVAIRWGARSSSVMVVTGMGVLLAGFWMIDVHLALFRQALKHQAPAGATTYHCSAAVLVFVLGVAWLWQHRRAMPCRSPHPPDSRLRRRYGNPNQTVVGSWAGLTPQLGLASKPLGL